MSEKQSSAVVRFFKGIWNLIDGARKLVLNLVFLLILVFVVMAFLKSSESFVLQGRTALVLDPTGIVVEQFSGSPLDQALQQASVQGRRETQLRDLTQAIRLAAADERINRLVINPANLWYIGQAQLQEVESAVGEFRASGKPVVALADNLMQPQYYLAALADEIWLNPEGMVWIDGFASYRNFFREAIDKLEIEINLFRAGEFKSAMDPWIRNDMSREDRAATLAWLGSLWQNYLEGISRHRGIPLVDLSNAVTQFADRLDAVEGDFSRLALETGLVDRLVSRPEANQELASLGAPGSGSEGYRQIGFQDYLVQQRLSRLPSLGPRVVVVVAEGEIVRGHQPPGLIGSDSLVERLRAVAQDANVRAVVLRVNSPGGETFASEVVRREVQALRDGGRTVVVSMGNVAASGAYWFAMAADEVWASPSTLTGSIGVFGILPTFSEPLARLGIHTDGVGTTPLAGRLRLDLPLDEDLRRIFQRATDQSYKDFLEVVSSARGMSVENVDAVARGQVWSGIQAKERGLVDQTGTLQEAVDSAARIAGLGNDYQVDFAEQPISPFESFLLDLTAGALARFEIGIAAPAWTRLPLAQQLLDELQVLAASGDEFSLTAHCLCRAP